MRATFGAVVGNVSTGVGEGVTTFTVTDGWHRNRHGHSDIDGSRQRWRCRDEAEYAGQSTARYISSTAGLEAGHINAWPICSSTALSRSPETYTGTVRRHHAGSGRRPGGRGSGVTTLLPGRKLLPRCNADPSLTNHR